MREYHMIKKEFEFLTRLYGFEVVHKQRSGSYCFVNWTNSKINIKVLYDATDERSVSILTYDADSLGTYYDVTTYQDELITTFRKSREKIHYAAEWLKNAIADKVILIQ